MLQVHLANFITHIQQLLNKSSKYSDMWEENLHTPDSLVASALRNEISQLLNTAVASLASGSDPILPEQRAQAESWTSGRRRARGHRVRAPRPSPPLRRRPRLWVGVERGGGPCQSSSPAVPAPGPPTAQGQHGRARRPRRPLAGCHVTLRGKQELRGAGGGGGPGRGRRAAGGCAAPARYSRVGGPGQGSRVRGPGVREGGLTSNISPSRKSIARQETMSA